MIDLDGSICVISLNFIHPEGLCMKSLCLFSVGYVEYNFKAKRLNLTRHVGPKALEIHT